MSHYGSWRNASTGQIIHNTSSTVVNQSNSWVPCDTAGQPINQVALGNSEPPTAMPQASGVKGNLIVLIVLLLLIFSIPIVVILQALPAAVRGMHTEHAFDPPVINGVTVYSFDLVKWLSRIPGSRPQVVRLLGKNTLIKYDVSRESLVANGDLTFEGDVSNSKIDARNGILKVRNVNNSTLIARKIIASGTVLNTQQILVNTPSTLPVHAK